MKSTIACLTLLILSAPAEGVDRDQWLHVAVDGKGHHDERVRINLPLTIVETVLPLIETNELHDGRVWINHEELTHEEIVKILASIRDAKDGEYVTVDSLDEQVRIAKEGKVLMVRFEEHGEKGEIRVPVAVLDALVSGEDDELDLLAAVRALGEADEQALVTVEESDATVRIWIDRKNESD